MCYQNDKSKKKTEKAQLLILSFVMLRPVPTRTNMVKRGQDVPAWMGGTADKVVNMLEQVSKAGSNWKPSRKGKGT